jgi:hypothetical protein
MTYEQALRILPSHASHLAQGQMTLAILRYRVGKEHDKLTAIMIEKLGQTTSGAFRTDEIKELDRKREQLTRFLETTQ